MPEDKCYLEKISDNEYNFNCDDKEIGKILLNSDLNKEDSVFIQINNQFKNRGYGLKLFNLALNILKEHNIKEIKVNIPEENYKMLKIISKYNAIHLTTIDGVGKYLIPIN